MSNYNDAGDFKQDKFTDEPLNVVLFVSRNKDNALPKFTQRKKSFLTTWDADDVRLKLLFKDFVAHGESGEMSRFYVSVNKRDNAKVEKALIHCLVDRPDVNMANLQAIVASLAMGRDFAVSKKRMFDVDIKKYSLDNHNRAKLDEFLNDLKARGASDIQFSETPNGYHVIIDRGVDLRGLVDTMPDAKMKDKKDKGPWKWSQDEIGYKIDDLQLVSWSKNIWVDL